MAPSWQSWRAALAAWVRAYMSLGVRHSGDHREDDHRTRLVNGMSLLMTGMIGFFLIIDVVRQAWIEVGSGVLYLVAFQLPVMLNHKGRQRLARIASVVLGFGCIIVNNLILGSSDIGTALLAGVAGLACILLPPREWRMMVALVAVTLLCGLLLLAADFGPMLATPAVAPPGTVRVISLVTLYAVVSALCLHANFETSRFVAGITESAQRRHDALRMAQANARLASLGEMAAGIAHEINNPLAVIEGNASLINNILASAAPDPAAIAGRVAKIRSTVVRISHITGGMLAFARQPGTGDGQAADVKAVVEAVTTMVHELTHGSGIRIQTRLPDGPLLVAGNPGWIQQIVLNLMTNARDALRETPPVGGGVIDVSVACRDDQVWVEVRDNGGGVPVDFRERIMEPFFTTKPVGTGTGLGLSVSRGLAQSMGGDLILVSAGRPTIFRLELCPAIAAAGRVDPAA